MGSASWKPKSGFLIEQIPTEGFLHARQSSKYYEYQLTWLVLMRTPPYSTEEGNQLRGSNNSPNGTWMVSGREPEHLGSRALLLTTLLSWDPSHETWEVVWKAGKMKSLQPMSVVSNGAVAPPTSLLTSPGPTVGPDFQSGTPEKLISWRFPRSHSQVAAEQSQSVTHCLYIPLPGERESTRAGVCFLGC